MIPLVSAIRRFEMSDAAPHPTVEPKRSDLGSASAMSTSLTIVQALVAIGVLILVVARRAAARPVRGDRRRWTLPLLLAVIGVVNLSHLSGQHPPV
ncbi:MAG: hypothetical protein ACRDSS_11090, partial [Actinocrinis sp.]